MNIDAKGKKGALSPERQRLIAVLELLSTRMQWLPARNLIASTGLHVSRGWQETISHARDAVYSDAMILSAYVKLGDAARWHTFVGNKQVSFFDLREQNEDSKNRIRTWALNEAVTDLKAALLNKPFELLSTPTEQDQLEIYKAASPTLLSTDLDEGKLYLQFFSTRAYSLKETLSVLTMPEEHATYFRNYEEVIGVKTKLIPCFDTVVVDTKNDLVEFRIDFAPGLTGDKDETAFAKTIGEFNKIVYRFIGQNPVGVGLMNLYPSINPMYVDRQCGRVTTLGFVATGKDSSSNNHGQIHRTKTQDFREDSFHVGGKLYVDKVTPYAIGVTWSAKPSKSDLYLELKGNVRSVYTGKLNAVSAAEFLGCIDGADYDFLSYELLSRLPRRKK